MVLHRISALIMVLLSLTAPTAAHEGRPVYIEVNQQTTNTFELRWKIPPVIASGEEPMIRISGANCTLAAGVARPSLIGTQLYRCTEEQDPMQINIRYPAANPALSALVLYRSLNGNAQSIMAGPEETTVPLPREATFWQVAQRYGSAGIEHILDGYDHLLFVLCLMLIAGRLKRILITVTGFTLGHSLTLALSALGSWSLPPTFVEPLIAFSIVMLAAEVARTEGKSRTLTAQRPAIVATGFGLLHGFGFGGALAEIGLPYGLKLQALAFFNLGVEIGQILFVLACFAMLKIVQYLTGTLSATAKTAKIKPFLIYPVGIVAAFWTVERTLSVWQ